MTNKTSKDWSSTLKMISTFADMGLVMAIQQPELIDAMEMSIAFAASAASAASASAT